MPSDLFLKAANAGHRVLLRLSFGRLGWSAAKMPVLELTTVGRRSGQPRSVMLTSPLQKGDALVIVASRGGDPHHPAWFLNLLDHPEVQVKLRDQPRHARIARVASPDERARMWPQITGRYRNYAGYQRKTDREIPVVLLELPDE